MKKEILLAAGCLVLIGFLILAGGGLWLLLRNKEEPVPPIGKVELPESWKTFRNTNYQFEFRYPADWSFEKTDNPNMLTVIIRKEDLKQEKMVVYGEEMTPFYEIAVYAEKSPENLSAREYYLNMFGESSKQKALEDMEEVTVGDSSGVKYLEPMAPASDSATAVIVAKGGSIYRFVYSVLAPEGMYDKYLTDFELLLQSVKFLE